MNVEYVQDFHMTIRFVADMCRGTGCAIRDKMSVSAHSE
jgi:hypothetical protein